MERWKNMLNEEVKWRQCRLLPLWGFFCRNFDLFDHFHDSFQDQLTWQESSGLISNCGKKFARSSTEKPKIWGRRLKNLFGKILIGKTWENIDWNYIGSLAWLGSQDPLFSQAGGVRTIHAISNLPHGHSSSQTFFGHFQRIDLVFFTVTKRTVGAFFLGTQGLSLASFGFRSPFQRWWNFISPNAYLFEGYT